jgi:hypothetical protein
MSNEDHCSYDIKLNRWMNIQSKPNLILLIVLTVLCLFYVATNVFTQEIDHKGVIIFCCGCVLIMVVKLLCHPKCLTVTPETVKFQYRGALLNLLTTGRVRYSSNQESRYEKTYTVYNIREITYGQSPLEKMFSCGHIRIRGDVDTAHEQTFVIYGVKDFQNTAEWMKDYIKTSADN